MNSSLLVSFYHLITSGEWVFKHFPFWHDPNQSKYISVLSLIIHTLAEGKIIVSVPNEKAFPH